VKASAKRLTSAFSAAAEHGRKRHVGREQRARAAERRVVLRGRRQGVAGVDPHRRVDDPADQIDVDHGCQAEHEDEKTDDDGEPILVQRRRRPGGGRGTDICDSGVGHDDPFAGNGRRSSDTNVRELSPGLGVVTG
jgi:hypothetical protein